MLEKGVPEGLYILLTNPGEACNKRPERLFMILYIDARRRVDVLLKEQTMHRSLNVRGPYLLHSANQFPK